MARRPDFYGLALWPDCCGTVVAARLLQPGEFAGGVKDFALGALVFGRPFA